MLTQLDRLLGVTGFRNVRLGVIPMDAVLSGTPYIGFLILDDLTYLETHTSENLLHGEESAAYHRLADALAAESVSGDAARELISIASGRTRTFLESTEPDDATSPPP
jgi:hypothetical protein